MCTKGERRKTSRRRRFLQALRKWDTATACFPLIYWLVLLLSMPQRGHFSKSKNNNFFYLFWNPPSGLKIHVLTLRGLTCAALKPWLASYKSTEGNILQLNIIYSGHFPERADVLQKSSRVELFFVTVHGILRFFLMMDVDAWDLCCWEQQLTTVKKDLIMLRIFIGSSQFWILSLDRRQ